MSDIFPVRIIMTTKLTRSMTMIPEPKSVTPRLRTTPSWRISNQSLTTTLPSLRLSGVMPSRLTFARMMMRSSRPESMMLTKLTVSRWRTMMSWKMKATETSARKKIPLRKNSRRKEIRIRTGNQRKKIRTGTQRRLKKAMMMMIMKKATMMMIMSVMMITTMIHAMIVMMMIKMML